MSWEGFRPLGGFRVGLLEISKPCLFWRSFSKCSSDKPPIASASAPTWNVQIFSHNSQAGCGRYECVQKAGMRLALHHAKDAPLSTNICNIKAPSKKFLSLCLAHTRTGASCNSRRLGKEPSNRCRGFCKRGLSTFQIADISVIAQPAFTLLVIPVSGLLPQWNQLVLDLRTSAHRSSQGIPGFA